MTAYKCPTCNKVHSCDNNECKNCSIKNYCHNNLHDDEIEENECWDCRKGNITFSLGGGI